MEKMLLLFVFIFLAACPTEAQVGTGTIVTFQLTRDKFVIAADSRVNREGMPSDDHECKISAFKTNSVIFAATGIVGYPNNGVFDLMPSWNVMDEARRAVIAERMIGPTKTATDAVKRISEFWESNMLTRWSKMMLYHPDLVRYTASKNNGGLTHGIFAAARGGSIAIALTAIVFDNGNVKVEHPSNVDCTANPCASGIVDVYNKYMTSGKEFMTASPKEVAAVGYELLRVIKLVDLTIAEDKSETIGGTIDALEFSNNGTIRWHYKKDNCPENSD
jgi:hypothetical protein